MDDDDYENMPYNEDDDDYDNMSYYDESDDNRLCNDEDINDSTDEADNKDENENSGKRYTILNEVDIMRLQNEQISDLSSVFMLSKAEATVLLCHYNWSTSNLHNEWFVDEEKVRTKVGLLINSINTTTTTNIINCGICFDDFKCDEIRHASCGHDYCVTCWKTYIGISINETGSRCLSLRCPAHKCTAAVDCDMINELASEEEKSKYLSYLTRSYVEFMKRKTKWCPAPGCNKAIEYKFGSSDFHDVICDCSYGFCFNCGEEPHRPVECKVVEQWILKNTSEAENTKWILAFTKPCPKCKRPIEKNTGCNHMTCPCVRPNGHHFCWACGESMKQDHHTCKCNGFSDRDKMHFANDDDGKLRQRAKLSIERYRHYYERFASNNKSREKAISDYTQLKEVNLQLICDKLAVESILGLNFILKAWERIIECRGVLKWTYAYAHILLEHNHKKREFFEYLQGDAETALERLHFCAERELKVFTDIDGVTDDKANEEFNKFRAKLVDLTKITGTFFDNLVKGIENGLSEVSVEQTEPELQPAPAPNKKKKGSTSGV